ncbi:hypothetical protein RHGRI_032517 [Rhododendron griersonianum]|uniref:Tubulin alpha-6 chain n=1 Tax=Rhododendron griersonianum TaxID=479676 RepID=A0AAV6IGZ3_9ERIC|nr:hypothetical protein RHGRI_032517 [Rhododendron griersonianum]
MASLQILKYSLSPFSVPHSNSPRKSCCFCSESKSQLSNRRFLGFRSSKVYVFRGCRISCKVQEGDNKTNGEEPPESLFMKELRKRGMTPTSLLEETDRSVKDEEIKLKEEGGGYSKRNAVSTDYEKSLSNQRERSMALNSEGLEVDLVKISKSSNQPNLLLLIQGLIPRAKLLLSTGGTFFLGFGPLILITVASFSALYLYFGPTFVHDASKIPITPPQYIDPYVLLEDERISQMAPLVK